MSTPTQFQSHFTAALPYPGYLATGTDEQQRRWTQVYQSASLTPAQRELAAGFTRQLHLLILSGIWCGDCVQQCPLIERIAEASAGRVLTRYLDRDQHKDLSSQYPINGGSRVPVVLGLSEDFELCGVFGDRTLSRYRALARRQLGAACPTGIGPADPDEQAATLQDWLDEIERLQLMLRLSPRLRQKHND